jgi:eukaryotic-like serine/threonine-protein kinase
MASPAKSDDSGARQTLEVAHVLFVDLVGYSLLATDAQQRVLRELQEAVRQTAEYQRAQGQNDLICLPTGDGMALVFFREPEAPVRCALELSKALRGKPEIMLRMGIHSGPVYRMADVNANLNVAGGGINLAQRVMDCGDAKHILVSKATADLLKEASGWNESLEDLGEAEVKHGLRLHLFNLCTLEAGRRERPAKLRLIRARKVRHAVAWTTAAVVAAAAVGSWLFFGRKAHALTDKDTIVLADFANSTGEPVFDGALRQGLSVELEQSPFLSLVSDQRVRQTLRLMGQPADARLTPEIAREICQRAGSAAALDGSIVQVGTQYLLTLKAVNCASGDSLASAEAQASDKSYVLDALGKAGSDMRKKLGESLSSVQKYDTPLEQATTPSLEALKTYTLGQHALNVEDDMVTAISLFKRAIDLDPNFAKAYAGLATCYWNEGDVELASASAKKAYELRDHVSEREKLSIEMHYEIEVAGNLEATEQTLRLQAQTYPRDVAAIGNLGVVHSELGKFDTAIEDDLQALKLDPTRATNYSNLASAYRMVNRFADARSAIEQARKRNLDSPYLHMHEYALDFLGNDSSGMVQQLAWAVGKSGFEDSFVALEAATQAYRGKLGKGRELTQRAVAIAQQGHDQETAAAHKAFGALVEALYGNARVAREEAHAALGLSTGREVQPVAATALAIAGEVTQAESLAADLQKRYPEDTLQNFKYIPTIRAAAEVSRKNGSKAVEMLRPATSVEFGETGSYSGYPAYVRGEAYLLERKSEEGAAEFQKILDHSGLVLNEPIGALAHLQIGRAYAMQGDTAKARAAYHDFLTLWEDADPDIPVLKQAKAEYAKLQ